MPHPYTGRRLHYFLNASYNLSACLLDVCMNAGTHLHSRTGSTVVLTGKLAFP